MWASITSLKGTATVIFIATTVADIILPIVIRKPGLKFISKIAVGVAGGTGAVLANNAVKWPG